MKLYTILILILLNCSGLSQIKEQGYKEFEEELDSVLLQIFDLNIKSLSFDIKMYTVKEDDLSVNEDYQFNIVHDSLLKQKGHSQYSTFLIKKNDEFLWYRKKFNTIGEEDDYRELELDSAGFMVYSWQVISKGTTYKFNRLRKYFLNGKIQSEHIYRNSKLFEITEYSSKGYKTKENYYRNDSLVYSYSRKTNQTIEKFFSRKNKYLFEDVTIIDSYSVPDSNLFIDSISDHYKRIDLQEKKSNYTYVKTYKSFDSLGRLIKIRRHKYDEYGPWENWMVKLTYK